MIQQGYEEGGRGAEEEEEGEDEEEEAEEDDEEEKRGREGEEEEEGEDEEEQEDYQTRLTLPPACRQTDETTEECRRRSQTDGHSGPRPGRHADTRGRRDSSRGKEVRGGLAEESAPAPHLSFRRLGDKETSQRTNHLTPWGARAGEDDAEAVLL